MFVSKKFFSQTSVAMKEYHKPYGMVAIFVRLGVDSTQVKTPVDL